MQVAFFLTPKSETAYLLDTFTLRQALEKMEYHHYSAMPVVNADGRYQYALFLEDCVRVFKANNLMTFTDTEKISLSEVVRYNFIDSVNISATLTDLIDKAVEHNFIPVVDDQGIYIGLVRRSTVINYCRPMLLERGGMGVNPQVLHSAT